MGEESKIKYQTLDAYNLHARLSNQIKSPEALRAARTMVLAEIERRRRENPLKYFVPNGAIERLIQAVGEHGQNKKFIFILAAANSVGKSAATVALLGNIIWGAQNEYFEFPLFTQTWTYPKVFWYVTEHTVLKDFIAGTDTANSEIRKWFPPERYEFSKAGQDYYSKIQTDTGWTGSFRSYDQDAKQFEAVKIGVAILDEPPPEAIFNAILARLTLGGIILMPMTPLNHSAWVYDRYINQNREDTYVLYADIEENCAEHGKRGRLSHSQIETIVSNYDDDEREARAHGKFTHLAGLVYKQIHPAIHRHDLAPHDFTQEKYRIYCVLDPHDRKPPMIGWFAVDHLGNAWLLDEFPSPTDGFKPFHTYKSWSMTTEDMCRYIRDKEIANGWSSPWKIVRVIDPNYGLRHQQSVGMTVQEHISKIGRELNYPLNFRADVNDNVDAGHNIVKDYLHINADGETRFRVAERCSNIWHDLTHYTYDERSNKFQEKHGMSEAVAQKYKDGADVVRYFFSYLKKADIPVAKPEKPKTYDEMMDKTVFAKLQERALRRRLTPTGKPKKHGGIPEW